MAVGAPGVFNVAPGFTVRSTVELAVHPFGLVAVTVTPAVSGLGA